MTHNQFQSHESPKDNPYAPSSAWYSWQPMETAPKDGRLIVVWYNVYPVFPEAKQCQMMPAIAMWSTWDRAFRLVGVTHWAQSGNGTILNGLELHQPTRWLEIPDQ